MNSEWVGPFLPRFCLKQEKHNQDLTIAIEKSGPTKVTAMPNR